MGAEVHSENSFVQYEKMAPAEVRKRQVGSHHGGYHDHHDHEHHHDIDHADHEGASRGDLCVPDVAQSSEKVFRQLCKQLSMRHW